MAKARMPLTMTVNGTRADLAVEPRDTLIEVLRERLHLTGTKEGCSQGECGACTVLVDGAPRYACLTLALDMAGRQVTTIEGVAGQRELHPLQAAFVQAGAVQCGYCTPGMVLSALALLREHPHPDAAMVRQALVGNICRCTGYDAIVRAVLAAAAAGAEPVAPPAKEARR